MKLKTKTTAFAVHKLVVSLNRVAQELMEEGAYFTHKVIVRNGGKEHFSDLYMQCLAYLSKVAQKPKETPITLSLKPEWAIIIHFALNKQAKEYGITALVGDTTHQIYSELDQKLLTVMQVVSFFLTLNQKQLLTFNSHLSPLKV